MSPSVLFITALLCTLAFAQQSTDVSESSKTVPPTFPEQPAMKPAKLYAAETRSPYPNLKGDTSLPVNKKLLDAPIADIHWVGKDHRTVLVLSEKGHVYRSLDSGRTWTTQLGKLASSSMKLPIVDAIAVSPVDSSSIFLMGSGHENWVSSNGGKTFNPTASLSVQTVHLHPNQKDWILAESLSSGCRTTFREECHKSLHVSKDFGKKWTKIESYVAQAEWGPKGHGDDVIYAAVHEDRVGNQEFGSWNSKVHFVRTSNYFRTVDRIIDRGNRFIFSEGSFLFVAQVHESNPNQVVLRINQDNATSSHFHQAEIPEGLSEHSYTILDTSEGSVFLHVNHEGPDAMHGNIYVSSADGKSYSLSLPYNRRNRDGKCDFERVQGLEGVYLANYLHSYADGSIGEKATSDRHVSSRGKRYHGSPKTVISFDKGAVWSYLAPPAVDVYGEPIQCRHEDSCSLHLHGITDAYGPFYSEANAIGLLMATGTVGKHLLDTKGSVNTYFSRDAGLSWFQVAKGSHIYEFGDHGSILVMANDESPTTFVVYSSDQGLSWNKVKVSETPIEIENIIIEPTATSENFIIYGWQDEAGVLIHIDFADLHPRSCIGADAPTSAESDYELWTPNDGRLGGQCLLGRKISYTRRKRDRACFNAEDFETVAYYDHCSCTEFDFECDAGYARNIEGGPCLPQEGLVPEKPPQSCSNFYHRTKGYRRVAGDSCIGGAEWEPELVPCPAVFMSTHRFGSAVMLLLFVVIVTMLTTKFTAKYDVLGYLWVKAKDQFSHVKYARVVTDDFADAEEYGAHAELFDDDMDHQEPEIGFEVSGRDDIENPRNVIRDFTLPAPERRNTVIPPLNPAPGDI